MKCDPTAVTVITAAFIPLAGGLFCIRRKTIQFFAIYLCAFSIVELVIMWSGVGESLWWLMHFPSAVALGVDEILETHGIVLSTAAHVADLVLWAILLTMPIVFRTHQIKKRERNSQH